jgi:GNAT superfamily N-acetyltransferase
VLRRASGEDVVAVADLFRRSFGTLTFLPTLHTPAEDRRFFERVFLEREVWVWEEDGRILGFAALDGNELSHFYVEPDENGRGIGSALMERVKERRPDGVELWVFQQNENARRFYEARGFRLEYETDGADNEERMPDARYAWRPGS